MCDALSSYSHSYNVIYDVNSVSVKFVCRSVMATCIGLWLEGVGFAGACVALLGADMDLSPE